eukprot:jgi/Tetstr1/440385/TSEL_028719.t1
MTAGPSGAALRIGIVGAGVSGLSAARVIAEAFPPPAAALTVFEWGRGPGGRTARRRATAGDLSLGFEHAAPFFDLAPGDECPAAEQLVGDWASAGWAKQWQGDFLALNWADANAAAERQSLQSARWVGYPASNSLCKGLAGALDDSAELLYGQHVLSAQRDGGAWAVEASAREDGSVRTHTFDLLLLSDKLLLQDNKYGVLPADYAGPLEAAKPVRSSCVAVLMAAFPAGSLPPFDVLELAGHPVLSHLVRDSGKPGRDSAADVLVAHSTAAYAEGRLKEDWFDDQDAAQAELLAALRELLEDGRLGGGGAALPEPLFAQAHMWDCAQPLPEQLLGASRSQPCLWDAAQRIGACGDFCSGGGGVVGAGLSGAALGTAAVEALAALGGERTDFAGNWVRNNAKCSGMDAYLAAHGHSDEKAAAAMAREYRQEWARRGADPLVWTVATEARGGGPGATAISRSIEYPLGEWEEPFQGRSTLFGDKPGVAVRRTAWAPHAGSATGVAHVTTSQTPVGREETRRWLEGPDVMICQRTFLPPGADEKEGVTGTERFVRG